MDTFPSYLCLSLSTWFCGPESHQIGWLQGYHPHQLGSRLVTPEVVQSELWLNFHPSWKFLCLGLLWYFSSLVFPHLFALTQSLSRALFLCPHLKSGLTMGSHFGFLLFHYGQWPWNWSSTSDLSHLLFSLHTEAFSICTSRADLSQESKTIIHNYLIFLPLYLEMQTFLTFVTTKRWDSLHINYKYEANELTLRDKRWSINWSIFPMDESVYHIKNELSIRRLFN